MPFPLYISGLGGGTVPFVLLPPVSPDGASVLAGIAAKLGHPLMWLRCYIVLRSAPALVWPDSIWPQGSTATPDRWRATTASAAHYFPHACAAPVHCLLHEIASTVHTNPAHLPAAASFEWTCRRRMATPFAGKWACTKQWRCKPPLCAVEEPSGYFASYGVDGAYGYYGYGFSPKGDVLSYATWARFDGCPSIARAI